MGNMCAQLVAVQTRAFTKGECRVLVSEEPIPTDWAKNLPGVRTRTHLSISCIDRYPTWEEIKDARYSLCGLGLYMAMVLPPQTEYVNIHPNTFHLFEIPDPRTA